MRITHALRAVGVAGLLAGLAVSVGEAKAPHSKDVPQPVDTSAGSISDPKHLLQVDLERSVTVGISGQPLDLALIQISGLLGIEWGYAAGIDQSKPISISTSGPASKVLHAVGSAANVRFEAVGPLQIRVLAARAAPTPKKTTPPPAQHP